MGYHQTSYNPSTFFSPYLQTPVKQSPFYLQSPPYHPPPKPSEPPDYNPTSIYPSLPAATTSVSSQHLPLQPQTFATPTVTTTPPFPAQISNPYSPFSQPSLQSFSQQLEQYPQQTPYALLPYFEPYPQMDTEPPPTTPPDELKSIILQLTKQLDDIATRITNLENPKSISTTPMMSQSQSAITSLHNSPLYNNTLTLTQPLSLEHYNPSGMLEMGQIHNNGSTQANQQDDVDSRRGLRKPKSDAENKEGMLPFAKRTEEVHLSKQFTNSVRGLNFHSLMNLSKDACQQQTLALVTTPIQLKKCGSESELGQVQP